MSVGTISLVGISVVFFTFLVLFLLFKLLAKLFGEKASKSIVTRDVSVKNSNWDSGTSQNTVTEEYESKLVAAITAAICAHTSHDIRILGIKEKKLTKGAHWKTQRTKIWRPQRKGVKKAW